MDQYTSPSVEPLLNESIAGVEMLEDVVVFHVINLDDVVLVIGEEMGIQRQAQGG